MRSLFVVFATMFVAASVAAQCPPAGTDWCSGTYQYDAMGNIRSIGNDAYEYDTVGRLVKATADYQRSGVYSRQDYSYDAFGNRTGATRTNGSLGCVSGCELSYGIDPATNRINTNGAHYDDAGNLTAVDTATYVYDGAGSLAHSTVGVDDRQYIYTADDERIATRNGVSWTWTVRTPDQKILREFSSAEVNGLPTSNRQWLKDYVWRDGALLASIAPTTLGASTTTTLYYHLDHLGTPRVVTDSNGKQVGVHAYYAFGAELSLSPHETAEELLKFTGHERDLLSSGDAHTLDDMHARYYMAAAGRVLSVDPTWSSADLGKPQSWNRYSYVLNNPVRYTDPDGRCTDPATCAIEGAAVVGPVGGVVGAAIGVGIMTTVGNTINWRRVGEFLASVGNGMSDTSGGERAAERSIQRNNASHIAEKVDATAPMQSQSAPRSNPLTGEPGSTAETTRPDGTVKQVRQYGSDGYPETDVDHDHDHGQGKPHSHDWGRPSDGSPPTHEDRGPGRPPKPTDPKPSDSNPPER